MSSEFEFIDHIKSRFSLARIGDDCAVLPKDDRTDLVITADMLVEDVDFRLDWSKPEFIGHKALAVSISDVAAMGATPRSALISIAVPERHWERGFLDHFYDGWHRLASEFGVELVGGDVSRTTGPLVIDSILIGDVPKGRAVLRSGAKPGDRLFVTGPVGGAAAGLQLLESGVQFETETGKRAELLANQLTPIPRSGSEILAIGASAMIDVSDGLVADLAHICRASGVGAAINLDSIPFADGMAQVAVSKAEQLEIALNGGEDFELLFTIDAKNNLPSELGGYFEIGVITTNVEILELIDGSTRSTITPVGYQHFS